MSGDGENGVPLQAADENAKQLSKEKQIVSSTSGNYEIRGVVGHGSFGVVYEAFWIESNCIVAIKKVLQDPRYKNREVDIMKMLNHPNVIKLLDYYYTEEQSNGGGTEKYLNAVIEYVPDNSYKIFKSYVRADKPFPLNLVKLYTYQMLNALAYLHSLGICHRDIKPQNLLVDPEINLLKLCDMGSAKMLVKGENSVSYICSRFYRAPELILGCTAYTCAIDAWSAGCVMGEFLLGKPLFPGDTSLDQLVRIILILGSPDCDQLKAMNLNCTYIPIPYIQAKPLKTYFPDHVTDDALSLLSLLLRYEPEKRTTPLEALQHQFFDDIRQTLPI